MCLWCPSLQEMSSAVITYCGHFFHGNCLRKWLYVQETCPMCHQPVRPTAAAQSPPPGDAPAAPPREPDLDPAAQNQDETPQDSQGDAVAAEASGPLEERGAEPPGQAHRLRFSSTGDFVGFVEPEWSSCSTGGVPNSHVLLSETESEDAARPPTPDAVIENAVTLQPECSQAEAEVTSSPAVPQNTHRNHDGHDTESWNGSDPCESHAAPSSPEASGTSLVHSQTSDRSNLGNSELTDPQTCTGNSTCSDPDMDVVEAESVPQTLRLS